MTAHIAHLLHLDTPPVLTHYLPAFSARGVCGAFGPHSSDPTCPACQTAIQGDDDRIEEDEPLPRRWGQGE